MPMLQRLVSAVLAVLSTPLTVWTLGLFMPITQLSAATNDGITPLALTLQSAKQDFILGEPVPLVFKVKNESNSRIELPGVVDVLSGGVRLRIAFENGPYREYRGPMWG